MAKKFIGSVDVVVDDETGALLVELASQPEIDIGDVDMTEGGRLDLALAALLAKLSDDPATQATLAAVLAALATVQKLISPPVSVPLGGKTSGAGWDNGGEFELPENVVFCHVGVDEDTYLIANGSADDPTGEDPADYKGPGTHVVPCYGQAYLHFKQISAASAVRVTAYCMA